MGGAGFAGLGLGLLAEAPGIFDGVGAPGFGRPWAWAKTPLLRFEDLLLSELIEGGTGFPISFGGCAGLRFGKGCLVPDAGAIGFANIGCFCCGFGR